MRHARHLIASIVGVAIWCVAASTVAYAQVFPEPPFGGGVPRDPGPALPAGGTELWKFALVAAIAALLAVAVVGLIASLRHSRSERPSPMAHA